MIRIEGGVLSVVGPMTIDTVARLKAEAAALFTKDLSRVELAQVTDGDSAGLALLLDWMRRSRDLDRPIVFSALPKAMSSLASLYGLSELFQQQSQLSDRAPGS